MPITTILDNLIDVVFKIAGTGIRREPTVNLVGNLVITDDPGNDAINVAVAPTTPWVVVSDADSPYQADPLHPWIAVDFRSGDVQVNLWFGIEGDALHLVDIYGAQGGGNQVTVDTSRTRYGDNDRQVIADGEYSAGFNYQTEVNVFDPSDGAPAGIAYFRFRTDTDGSTNNRDAWVHTDGATLPGPLGNAAHIASSLPNFSIAASAMLPKITHIASALPNFTIAANAAIVATDGPIAMSLPNFGIAASASVANKTTIAESLPNFSVSAAAAGVHISGTASVNTADTQTVTVTGLSGSPTWSLGTNASGGSINSSSGAYVAGDIGGGGQLSTITDVVHVTDGTYSANFSITVNAALPIDVTPTWKIDATTLSGGHADGDTVTSWNNFGSAGFTFATAGGAPPVYKTNIIAGRPIVRFNGTTNWMNSVATFDNLAALTHYTTFFLGTVTPTVPDLGTPEASNGVFGDTGGYYALTSTTSTNALFKTENYPNVIVTGSQTLITSPVIAISRINGTTMGIQVTSTGSEITATGPATIVSAGSSSFTAQLGRGYSVAGACDISYGLGYNVELTASQRARTINFLKSLGGSSL